MTDVTVTRDQIAKLVEAFLTAEGEQIVKDMARHVGDEVHAVLARHGMMMQTTAGAIGVGVLAASQVLGDTLEFARRSMDGDDDDEAMIQAAVVELFVQVAPSELGLTTKARLEQRIAEAVASERERCAEIAEQYDGDFEQSEYAGGMKWASGQIAADIRQGTTDA